jgi:hypothetical protein
MTLISGSPPLTVALAFHHMAEPMKMEKRLKIDRNIGAARLRRCISE